MKRKRVADGVAQVVEHLPSKCETLSSNPLLPKMCVWGERWGETLQAVSSVFDPEEMNSVLRKFFFVLHCMITVTNIYIKCWVLIA
jgi:hypothetical protein